MRLHKKTFLVVILFSIIQAFCLWALLYFKTASPSGNQALSNMTAFYLEGIHESILFAASMSLTTAFILYQLTKHYLISPLYRLETQVKSIKTHQNPGTAKTMNKSFFPDLMDSISCISNTIEQYHSKYLSTHQALLHSENRFQNIIKNTYEYIWEMSPEGKFYFLTDKAEDIYGRDVEFLKGKYIQDFMSSERKKELTQKLKQFAHNNKSFNNLEIETIHRNGLIITQRLSGTPVLDDHNAVTFFRGIGLDVTENRKNTAQLHEREKTLKSKIDELNNTHRTLERNTKKLERSERELILAQNEAEKANITQSHFLTSMSQEIRSPINGILGMLQLLLNSSPTKEQQRYLDIAQNSTSTLFELVNDILDLTKLKVNQLKLEEKDYNLEDVIEDIVWTIRPKADEKKLTLKFNISEDVKTSLHGDAHRLKQILNNLLSNAIKFTAQGSINLLVACEKMKNRSTAILKFTVRDTGIGLDTKTKKTIISNLKNEKAMSTSTETGVGLGLQLCKKLCDLMDGELHINENYQGGAEIYFTVKCKLAEKDVPRSIINNQIIKSKKSKVKILIAEDNSINQIYIETILHKKGYQVNVARNGLEAVEFVKKNKVDLILMDLKMPKMDGFEAIKIIRSMSPAKAKTPIIALTANMIEKNKDIYNEIGIDDYLPKPVHQDLLIKKLQNFV